MSQKKVYEKLLTPIGVAKYPRLNKPETEVNGKPCEPRYKITLVLDEKDKGVAEFIADLNKRQAAAIAAAKKTLKPGKKLTENDTVKPHLDDEDNVVDGKWEITAKTSAVAKDGTPKSVVMFDAKGKPVKGAKVGGGSRVKLSVTPSEYNSTMGAGVALYLNAVQIIELVEFTGGGSAKSHGFGEEEGYSADDSGEEEHGEPDFGGEEQQPEQEEQPKTPRKKGDF